MFFGNSILRTCRILMDKKDDDKGGGGGGGGDRTAELEKQLADEKAKNEAWEKRIAALEGRNSGDKDKDKDRDKGDDDLAEKARKEREAKEKQGADTAKLEKAIRFTTGMADFIKTNATLLPKSLEGILAQAEKEKYENAMDKAAAVQVALVSEFFSVQSNLDLLTESQKNALAEFQALTKNVKQERVQNVYDMIFEPAFATLKAVTKAKQVREGEVDPANEKAAYAKRIADMSKNKFIKKGAK